MKPRTLLPLALVTLLLGGFIFFYEKDLPSTNELQQLEKRVLGLKVEEIAGLEIRRFGETLRFERHDLDDAAAGDAAADDPTRAVEWHLVAPLAARADSLAVATLLRKLVELESAQHLDEVDRKEAGLEEPVAEVTLRTSQGETTLQFGAMVPASQDRFVAIAGQPGAHVAAANTVEALRPTASEWRDKTLLPGLRSEIERLLIANGTENLELSQSDDGTWQVLPAAETYRDRADADSVGALTSALSQLRAETFVDASPLSDEGMGLDPALASLQIFKRQAAEPVDVLLGIEVEADADAEGTSSRYARVAGELVTLQGEQLFDLLRRPAEDWRSKAWSHLEVFQVEQAEFQGSGLDMTLQRNDNAWTRDGEAIEYSAVSDLLYAMAELHAAEVVSREQAAVRGHRLDDELLHIVLTTLETSEELRLYAAAGDLHAATEGSRDAVLLISADEAAELERLAVAVSQAEAPAEMPQAQTIEDETEIP